MKWKDWKLSTLELFSISWLFYNLGNKNTSYTENHEEEEFYVELSKKLTEK